MSGMKWTRGRGQILGPSREVLDDLQSMKYDAAAQWLPRRGQSMSPKGYNTVSFDKQAAKGRRKRKRA